MAGVLSEVLTLSGTGGGGRPRGPHSRKASVLPAAPWGWGPGVVTGALRRGWRLLELPGTHWSRQPCTLGSASLRPASVPPWGLSFRNQN